MWCQRSCAETCIWTWTWGPPPWSYRSTFPLEASGQQTSKSSCGFCGIDCATTELWWRLGFSWFLFAFNVLHKRSYTVEWMPEDCGDETKPFSCLSLVWRRSRTKWWVYWRPWRIKNCISFHRNSFEHLAQRQSWIFQWCGQHRCCRSQFFNR